MRYLLALLARFILYLFLCLFTSFIALLLVRCLAPLLGCLLASSFPLRQDKPTKFGVSQSFTGKEKSILEAQVEFGFAHVTERLLELLLIHLGKDIPDEEADEDCDRKVHLASCTIAALKPDLDSGQVARYINTAYVLENPDCYDDLYVDNEVLRDLTTPGDAKKLQEMRENVKTKHLQKKVVISTREKNLPRLFKKPVPPKYDAAKKKGPQRWLPKKNPHSKEVTAWLEKYVPSSVTLMEDDYNGRWRVISPDLQWRSISWTKRGWQEAAYEVLRQSWKYAKEVLEEECPFDLEALPAVPAG